MSLPFARGRLSRCSDLLAWHRRLTRLVTSGVLAGGSVLALLACNNIEGVEDAFKGGVNLAPAFAITPEFETFHEDLTLSVASCDGFDVIRHVVDDASFKTFFDQQGAPVRVSIHVVEDNTLTNSATGKYVQYPGVLNITVDVPTGVSRVMGTPIHITVPGEGNFIFDAGILIVDEAGNTLFEGGPHPFGSNPDASIFCSLLG